ncbi:MAG: BamA/TamA family outer membrane protein [Bacteroidetes bacterium]|nr:BamA/TamA family outer membrane protein [Bacteroidota bacterium]
MNRTISFYLFLFILIAGIGPVSAQEPVEKKRGCDTCCPQQDLVDLLFRGKNPFSAKEDRRLRAVIVPLIAYDPATTLQLGLGGSFSLQLGKPATTHISQGVASAIYTLKKQFFIQYKSNIYFRGNNWLLQSDWRYYIFVLPTYPLGTDNSAGFEDVQGFNAVLTDPMVPPTGGYEMDYSWIKFHNILSHVIIKNVYLGMGYHLDYHFNIRDNYNKIWNDTLYNTPHYSYSINHGFDPLNYVSSGLSLNFVYDNRDNQLNAYHGLFLNANYRYNFTWLGSSRDGSLAWLEFKTYLPLSKRCPRHLIAFWLYGSFLVSGDIPYLDLMSTSYDQMNASGRGYSQGRYRGEDYVYGEVEYRFPISPHSHILGGVLFTNVSTVSNRGMHVPLFGFFQPAAGAGLRIMVGKRDRTNIAIDFGFGNMSHGLYVQTQEVF